MKKRIGLLICLVLVMTCAMALADVKIDAETFPDAHFRDYLAEFDTDRNGSLSENEINAVKKIEVPGYAINNLKGIEVFTALEELNCGVNQLKELDLSRNTKLVSLLCFQNQLTSLHLEKNTQLETLSCFNNKLSSIDISKNTKLTNLFCEGNQIEKLDLSHNGLLVHVLCQENRLTVLDVSKCEALVKLVKSSSPTYNDSFSAYGWCDASYSSYLFIDENVKVIADGNIQVTSIKLNKTKATLKKGKTLQLKVKKIQPADATNKKVKWTTSDKKIATVSSKGKVKAKKKGTCIITCSAADGSGVKAECKITVK